MTESAAQASIFRRGVERRDVRALHDIFAACLCGHLLAATEEP